MTTRRLVASIAVLVAAVATGCGTVTSPTPSAAAAPATAMAEVATPTPTAEAATRAPVVDYGQPDYLPLPGRETSAQLTVEVRDLSGMAGLDLAIGLAYQVSGGSENATLLRLPIDESPYAAAMTPASVSSGSFDLWIFAGPPPCYMAFSVYCGGWDLGEPIVWPDYLCRMKLDIEQGEDRSIVVDGLPRMLPGQGAFQDVPGCPALAGL